MKPRHALLALAIVGSLGLAILGVFIIAGLRHTGRPLELPWQAHAAVLFMVGASVVRVVPETGLMSSMAGFHYGLSALLWSASYAIWLIGFVPMLRRPSLGTGCPP